MGLVLCRINKQSLNAMGVLRFSYFAKFFPLLLMYNTDLCLAYFERSC